MYQHISSVSFSTANAALKVNILMSAEELPSHPQLCVGWLCAAGMSVSLNMADFLEWLCMAAAAWTAHLGIFLCQCPLSLSLLHTHPTRLTHHACKHGHACCLHPVSVLLLIGDCLVIFLYLLIFSHPRKRILFFPSLFLAGKRVNDGKQTG